MFQSRISSPRQQAVFPPEALPAAPREVARTGAARARPATGALLGFDCARAFFADRLAAADPRREHLFTAFLDRSARCIHSSCHDGDEGGVDWPLRWILLEAARCNASGLIVAHNHPSGDPAPSPADLVATRRLATAADAIDLTLVDHLLFARDHCLSFRRMGLL